MNTNFITPIQPINSLSSTSSVLGTQKTEDSGMFKSIFESAVQNVEEAEAYHEQQQYLLATGQIDDVHTVTIAASEAQLAVDMLVQLRNKAIDAYNELIRISL